MAMSAAASGLVSHLTAGRTFPRVLAHSLCSRLLVSRCSKLFSPKPLKKPSSPLRFWPMILKPLRNRSALSIARGKMVAVETAPGSSDSSSQKQKDDDLLATELRYFQDMFALKSKATFLALVQEAGRLAVIVDGTILYPQGGGQPRDTGYISALDEKVKFRVEDVRAKNGFVYHYGSFDSSEDSSFQKGQAVLLTVDASRRSQNSRLHSAGHLLDACMKTIGLLDMEPGKGHHFPDSPLSTRVLFQLQTWKRSVLNWKEKPID